MINFKIINPIIPQNLLIKLSKQNLILPFYHTVSDFNLPHIKHLYRVRTTKEFIKDLEYLCKHFTPISISELEDSVYGNKLLKKPSFHLTFDDGLKEIYTEIAPILESKGIPATFFINTDFIDNKGLFYRYKASLIIDKIKGDKNLQQIVAKEIDINEASLQIIKEALLNFNIHDTKIINNIANLIELDFDNFLSSQQPYLTKQQIKELLAKGFDIGSHSLNHPYFKDIDINEKKRQINESFKFIEEEFKVKNSYFSFPFSDESVDTKFMDWMYEKANCKLTFGISGIKYDYTNLHLHRIPFEKNADSAQNILKNEYLYFITKSIFNKNRIKRQ